MPHRTINGCRYFYADTGQPEGRPDAPTVVFGHGFLMTHMLFEKQVAALRDTYRCVAFDWRGQGDSEVTSGGYGLWDLAADAAAFIEGMDLAPCHYVGHSMGGYVGFRLALRRPDLLRSLALMDTQAAEEPWEKRWQYYLMLAAVRLFGYRSLVTRRVMPIMFGPDFMKDPARSGARERWRGVVTSNAPAGIFRTGISIFSRNDIRDRLGQIRLPALLVVGEDDVATPPRTMRDVHERLPHSDLVIVPGSGHSAPIEQPALVNDALRSFLQEQSSA